MSLENSMTRRAVRKRLRLCLPAAAAAFLINACGAPAPLPPLGVYQEPIEIMHPGKTAVSEPISAPVRLGAAPPDFAASDWKNSAYPAEFCGIEQPVVFRAGEARANSSTWGSVHLSAEFAAFGNLLGDGREYAAVRVGCDNDGGTAAGLLAFSYVVLSVRDDQLWSVGAVVPKKQFHGYGPTMLRRIEAGNGQVKVTELWRRPADGTCCPSGVAETIWTLTDAGFVSGSPRVLE
ncbi:hypothetical protein APR11_005937 [Nocardia amikacinitolerans]|nr:hypothetical protein [Nocardia amikacinitolerans]